MITIPRRRERELEALFNSYALGLKECELCDNAEWRPGVTCQVPSHEVPGAGFDSEAEAAVQAITDQIMAQVVK